jgi:hypothetical protein
VCVSVGGVIAHYQVPASSATAGYFTRGQLALRYIRASTTVNRGETSYARLWLAGGELTATTTLGLYRRFTYSPPIFHSCALSRCEIRAAEKMSWNEWKWATKENA